MKKLLFILLTLTLCNFAYADVNTNIGKVDLTENQILNWQPNGIWTMFSYVNGEVIAVSKDKPTSLQIDEFKAELNNLPNTLPEKQVIERFNAQIAIGREAQVFNALELMRLMPYSYTINELITFKNFWGGVANGNPYVGLKQVGLGLVASGQIQQSDYDKLNSILMEQGIDLGAH